MTRNFRAGKAPASSLVSTSPGVDRAHPLGLQPQAAAVAARRHLKKKCKLWAPTWQKEMGWPEVG